MIINWMVEALPHGTSVSREYTIVKVFTSLYADLMNQLFHFVHCPFCIRIRLTCGLLKIPYESIVLSYDDEETPKNLMGVKMLPIMKFSNGQSVNESLEIIKILDSKNVLESERVTEEFETLLIDLGKPIHNLCMPYWIFSPEFDNKSRAYFLKKKESKRGPFHLLAQKKDEFLNQLPGPFKALEGKLRPFYQSDHLTLFDILLASHLWGLYVVPEFYFPLNLHDYLQKIGRLCEFDYHRDFWRKKII